VKNETAPSPGSRMRSLRNVPGAPTARSPEIFTVPFITIEVSPSQRLTEVRIVKSVAAIQVADQQAGSVCIRHRKEHGRRKSWCGYTQARAGPVNHYHGTGPAGSSSGVAKGDFNGDGFADLAIGGPKRQ
jgi:hypothetical protein